MKEKIERVHYAHLRNDEFPTVYSQTVGIGQKHDMKSLHLEKSFGELASYQPEMEGLTVYLRKSKILMQAGEYEMMRDRCIHTVERVVRGFGGVELPETRQHYDVLSSLLEKHQAKTVASSSRAAETERLLRLETEVNGDAAVQAALTAFGLTAVARQLFAANRQYDETFRIYIAEKSAETHIDITALRRAVSKALTQFLDAVQYSAYLHEAPDYMPLISELRELNRYYIQQLKARAARRKNGKNTEEEPPIEPMGETK